MTLACSECSASTRTASTRCLTSSRSVGLVECGDHRAVDWRACDGVVRDDDHDGGDEDDAVTMLMTLKIVEFGVP